MREKFIEQDDVTRRSSQRERSEFLLSSVLVPRGMPRRHFQPGPIIKMLLRIFTALRNLSRIRHI